MNFARAISNRVFYMDEGGIYEDGSPEQIFADPLRENTRRFVRRLLVLELNIKSRDYDYLGMAGEIRTWCDKNLIAPKQANRVQLVFEEIMGLLLPKLEVACIQAVCEYSEQTELIEWTICYGGSRCDVTASDNDLSLAVLTGITEKEKYFFDESAELCNRLSLTVKRV
jgi:polar amino acid transport system ATP-binding protein